MYNRDSVVINVQKQGVDVASLSATLTSDPIDVGRFVEILAIMATSAHGGTSPTVDIKFQTSADKVNWVDLGDAFTQITTVDGVFLKKLSANFGKYIRAIFTMGGTLPTYTGGLSLVCKQ